VCDWLSEGLPNSSQLLSWKPKANGIVNLLVIVVILPFLLLAVVSSRLEGMVKCETLEENEMRVPTFYADKISQGGKARGLILVTFIAIIFGGIHCMGWYFEFPSHAEVIMWRVCATTIIVVPFIVTSTALAVCMLVILIRIPKLKNILETAFAVLLLFAVPCYGLARLLLVTETLISLRNLPLGAYEAVQWDVYIPHI
jgi:hypothetical protein